MYVFSLFFIVVTGCMKGREEMKEKKVKEQRGRDGVFNLLSKREQGEEVQVRQTS